MLKITLLAACLLLPVLPVHPAIVVVAPTGSSFGSFTITQDITFTITTGVEIDETLYFVLENWVTYDGSPTQSEYSPTLVLSKNGGTAQSYTEGTLEDNFGTNFSTYLTPGDGILDTTNVQSALSVNDTLTLKAGTYTLNPAPTDTYNPQCSQTFTGNMFISDSAGQVASNTVPAPEPGSAALLGLGLASMLGTLRRRRGAGENSIAPRASF